MTKLNTTMHYSELNIHRKIEAKVKWLRKSYDPYKNIINMDFDVLYGELMRLKKDNKDPPPTKPVIKMPKKITYKDYRRGWTQLSLFN